MWDTRVYVASYLKTENNYNGMDIDIFDTPKPFDLNHQPLSSDMDYQEYGNDISAIRRAYPPKEYVLGKIKVKDRVYLNDGENANEDLFTIVNNDNEKCLLANYEVVKVAPSNLRVRIDFKKIIK